MRVVEKPKKIGSAILYLSVVPVVVPMYKLILYRSEIVGALLNLTCLFSVPIIFVNLTFVLLYNLSIYLFNIPIYLEFILVA